MRILLPSLAVVLASVTSAIAAPTVTVSFSPEAQAEFKKNYGVREQTYLADDIKREVERALPNHQGSVAVTVVKAVPNRPTFAQMVRQPGLSFQSFGIGGAELKAVVSDENGAVVTENTTRWFEYDIEWSYGQSTWGDANTAFDRLGRNLTKAMAEKS
jgi:hypothetical protein